MTDSDASRQISNQPDDPPDPGEEQRRAMDAALSFLSYRPRTVVEVRRKLVERRFDDDMIEEALDRLLAVGLLNDDAFVATYVRDRISHRPMGIRRLTNELYVKGILRDQALPTIERVFEEEEVDERVLAMRAAEKKVRGLQKGESDDRVIRRRLRDHLARRGFSLDVVREVANECVGDS